MLRRLPKRPLPLTIFFVSLAAMLAAALFSLRLSSIVLLLLAALLSLGGFALSGKGGGT